MDKSREELPSHAHDYDTDDFTAESESKKSRDADGSTGSVTRSSDITSMQTSDETEEGGDVLYSNIRSLSELGSSTEEVDKTAGLSQ